MSKDIESFCLSCPTCTRYEKKAATELMLSHPTPIRPWRFVSQDILEFEHKEYLVNVDNYSDFYGLDPLINPRLLTKPTLPTKASHYVVSQAMALSLSQTSTRNVVEAAVNDAKSTFKGGLT